MTIRLIDELKIAVFVFDLFIIVKMAEVCLFFGENLYEGKRPTCTVSRGLQTVTDKSLQYEDGLHTKLEDCSSIIVHTDCRKSYTRPG